MSRDETADKGRETSSPRPLKKTLPILVADDDPVSRHLLVKTLQSWGHQVRTTDDGQKAWEMFKNGEVRLILTEWMLPGMDGVELCHRIRAASTGSSKPAYIVLLTSKNSVQDRVAAFNAGADVQGLFNSLVFLADDDVAVESWPGYQGWQADSCAVYSIPIRGLAWIKVSGARSFVFQLIFSSQDEPVMALPVTYHQERWATQTLTKTAAAGVADGWTAVDFTASDGSTQLDPATYGSSTIHVGNIGAKNFITTAVGNDINILIEGLNVSGKTWAADPTTSSAGVTLADGDVSNAQSVRYYHVVRMRARVDAAVAATGTSAITSQFRGMAGAF